MKWMFCVPRQIYRQNTANSKQYAIKTYQVYIEAAQSLSESELSLLLEISTTIVRFFRFFLAGAFGLFSFFLLTVGQCEMFAPADYHRFHSPVDGEVVAGPVDIDGTYYTGGYDNYHWKCSSWRLVRNA